MHVSYKDSGVNIEEGGRAVARYRELAAGTGNASVLSGIGGFAGMISLKDSLAMEEPVLVSGADGVGTKLDIAFKMGVYDTVGIDCVAMCVNDILCHGAKPLFFLDYLACGKLDAEIAAQLVNGAAAACRETGAVLLGGETAEMPGFYDDGKYDIAGFAVGIADRKKLVDGRLIQEGDALIGIASSGVHSNGFSLIRTVLPNLEEDFCGAPIGRVLLEPTRLYVKPVLGLMEQVQVRGMAHITGGGWYENIPRMFAVPMDGVIQFSSRSWEIPRIFARLACAIADSTETSVEAGMNLINADEPLRRSMFNTFNMGIGFALAIAESDCSRSIAYLEHCGYPAWKLGRISAPAGAGGELRFV
ncbi:MAG: phosphoribosylformylglycinamidine cyclo-ligase [Spirochaetaceae bacterium]|nr:phosphoribosylformylglycinamidine cyclo-ligase [Spirochaetaceae bacterium]